jgi:ABC-type nitrate/sulfonate/bicarbonate transport system permease component
MAHRARLSFSSILPAWRASKFSLRVIDALWFAAVALGVAYLIRSLLRFVAPTLSMDDLMEVAQIGGLTFPRVAALIVIATLVWVPIGVAIGLRPAVAERIQLIAQFLASFPVNLLFPVAVYPILKFDLEPNIWLSPLMILGAQWYILFNVLAGASAFPSDPREATATFRIRGWKWWRKVILPGVFPYFVTGAITASGGAWNASIVAEAYRRGLSGGIRHRVGFASAIVINPVLLLMDEPFSALDVLTAETHRTDFLDLGTEHLLPTKSVLMVTHNIEEAVQKCDKMLVLSSNPDHIAAEIPAHYCIPATGWAKNSGPSWTKFIRSSPCVSVNKMSGFLETLAAQPYDGRANLAEFARSHRMEIDDLFPSAEALHMLEFAEFDDGGLKLTAAGRAFVPSGADERKRLFKEHPLRFAPLTAHIRRVFEERKSHAAPSTRFEIELEDHLTAADAEQTLRSATAWGRYAELFAYDDKTRMFSIIPVG